MFGRLCRHLVLPVRGCLERVRKHRVGCRRDRWLVEQLIGLEVVPASSVAPMTLRSEGLEHEPTERSQVEGVLVVAHGTVAVAVAVRRDVVEVVGRQMNCLPSPIVQRSGEPGCEGALTRSRDSVDGDAQRMTEVNRREPSGHHLDRGRRHRSGLPLRSRSGRDTRHPASKQGP